MFIINIFTYYYDTLLYKYYLKLHSIIILVIDDSLLNTYYTDSIITLRTCSIISVN